MAVDPRLSLAIKPFDVGQTFNTLLSNIGQMQSQQRAAEQFPLQQQLLQSQVDQSQFANQINRIKSVALGAAEILPDLQSDNPEEALRKLETRRARLISQGRPTQDTDLAIRQLQTPEGQLQLARDAERAIQIGQQLGAFGTQGQKPARLREFEALTSAAGLSPEGKQRAARIDLGVEPRAIAATAKTVDIGGVPHVFDPNRQTFVPAEVGGEKVTSETVGQNKADIKQREEFGKLTGASRAKAIDSGFDRVNKISTNIRNIDRAINALDEGARTGAIESRFFPTIRSATKTLEQIQGELGLDVINSATFGALSEKELDLAKQIALPTGLDEEELKAFLREKREAQEKLRRYFEEQIDFLDKGGTVAGFLREKRRQLESQSPNATQGSQQQGQNFNSSVLGRAVTEQEIQETIQANPGLTREQLFQQLGINNG